MPEPKNKGDVIRLDLDTVPPPASGDAYSAETRVGGIPDELLKELMTDAASAAAATNAVAGSVAEAAASPRPVSAAPISLRAPKVPRDVPRIDEEEEIDNDDVAATMLHISSKSPPSARLGGTPIERGEIGEALDLRGELIGKLEAPRLAALAPPKLPAEHRRAAPLTATPAWTTATTTTTRYGAWRQLVLVMLVLALVAFALTLAK